MLRHKQVFVDMFPRTSKGQKPVDMFLTDRKIVDMFPEPKERTGMRPWTCFREQARGMIIYFISSCHVETVVLLTHKG